MQALFLFGERDHDKTYAEDQPGYDLAKVPPRRFAKINSVAVQIGDSQSADLLANRSLPRRAFTQRIVKPRDQQRDSIETQSGRDHRRRGRVFSARHNRDAENHSERKEHTCRDHRIDYVCQEAPPETCIRLHYVRLVHALPSSPVGLIVTCYLPPNTQPFARCTRSFGPTTLMPMSMSWFFGGKQTSSLQLW